MAEFLLNKQEKIVMSIENEFVETPRGEFAEKYGLTSIECRALSEWFFLGAGYKETPNALFKVGVLEKPEEWPEASSLA